ncbi:MAG: sodium-translocating pyrophosphatase [Thermoplasmatales archaeon]
MATNLFYWELFILIAALLGILYAAIQSYLLLRIPVTDKKAEKISLSIRQGANAFMRRQYTNIFIFAAILAIIIFIAFYFSSGVSTAWKLTLGFLVGSIGSAAAGLIGMNISVRANVRTAVEAKKGLNPALKLAFRGGTVTGLMVASLALLGLIAFYIWFKNPEEMVGYIFGASLVSLFARVGGGIYTKGADVGADLVGKVETGIPEDDPRNPAVIADNVGDNVGDCAGMGADLFETYVVTALASMLLGYLIYTSESGSKIITSSAVILPLAIGGTAIIATIIGSFFVKKGEKQRIMTAMYKGLAVAVILSAVGFYIVDYFLMKGNIAIFIDAIIGMIIMAIIVYETEYYTSERYKPVALISKASVSGTGTNIITGLAYGLQAVFIPAIVIVAGIVISFTITFYSYGQNSQLGLYGIAIAAASMLSATGMIISIDSYGPITDNAGGIAEMSGFDEKTRNEVTDPLDAVGNTTKAVTKGYAIGSAALAALTLFAAFKTLISSIPQFANIQLDDPIVVSGLLIGGALPFFFTSYLMNAVGKAASAIVEEVRAQFRNKPKILSGEEEPDYGKAVDIVTREALRQLMVPALIAVLTPIVLGFLLGPLAVGGLLLGVIISGFPLAIMMTVGGGAWDNAKKYIEQGNYGGKGSEAHKAAVVGDTVGDATKDTAGPAINPLVKVVNTISILFVGIIMYHYLLHI